MMTTLDPVDLLLAVRDGKHLDFNVVIATIDKHYRYTPTRFLNGLGSDLLDNPAGSNEGSCKIFAFAKLHDLSPIQTLMLFGDYYRKDVLSNPTGQDHGNIRRFMKYGWEGLIFHAPALHLH